jgi:hypothetical protein
VIALHRVRVLAFVVGHKDVAIGRAVEVVVAAALVVVLEPFIAVGVERAVLVAGHRQPGVVAPPFVLEAAAFLVEALQHRNALALQLRQAVARQPGVVHKIALLVRGWVQLIGVTNAL